MKKLIDKARINMVQPWYNAPELFYNIYMIMADSLRASDFLNKKAPDFKLSDEMGTLYSLADYRGQMVLLYFYPKDMTSGCTVEAQCFRDRLNDLKALKVQVLGVSPDSVESHLKFKEKENLNFPLLADIEKEVVQKYGVWQEKLMYGRKYMGTVRQSFLIDGDGIVVKHYQKVTPSEHAQEVIDDVKGI